MKHLLFSGLLFMIYSCFLQKEAYGQADGIAANLGLYVFPPDSVDKETQEYDEFQCYKWAKEQSGIDPMNIEVEAEQVENGPDGAAVKGAAGGAAAGAAIGAIAGDAGKGAAIGAAAGGMRGRRAGNATKGQQQAANEQAAAQAEAEMYDSFKRAWSVCMEGKGYTVK